MSSRETAHEGEARDEDRETVHDSGHRKDSCSSDSRSGKSEGVKGKGSEVRAPTKLMRRMVPLHRDGVGIK